MSQLSLFKKIHFVGIGGAGMGPIAQVLLERGYVISGSDAAANAITEALAERGARIHIGHAADQIGDAELMVMSTAIPRDNPERMAGEEAGLPTWHRAKILAEIMRERRAVAVSGTHGKTTTTSMLGMMLAEASFDPTVLIGGHLAAFGGNARIGAGDWVVAEADESDGSFLQMDPDRIILLNIEADHLDFYAGIEAIERTFTEFVRKLRPGGRVVACIDDPTVVRLGALDSWPMTSYSLANPAADLYAQSIETVDRGAGSRFVPVWHGVALEPVTLHVAGAHNVSNALGALATALELGADYDALRRALAAFRGAKRRFQHKGDAGGVTIIDDYAHHPTELAATLAAARGRQRAGGAGRIVGLFQPHRYSRTQALAEDFGRALLDTDLLVVTGVYSAGEAPIEGVSGLTIAQSALDAGHPDAHYHETLEDTRKFLAATLRPGDMLLTMGAGNVYRVGEQLLEDLAVQTPVG